MCENQGGFSKGYSTTDNLFILHMFVNIMKCKKKKLFCVFIDFAHVITVLDHSNKEKIETEINVHLD
jgi:hypothetical protein